MSLPERTSLALRFSGERIEVLDQTLLPSREIWIEVRDYRHMIECIQRLAVRGAPLIGIAAGVALAREAQRGTPQLHDVAMRLRAARPTAVNLMNAIDRLMPKLSDPKTVVSEAVRIFDEDVKHCEQMAESAARLINDGDRILTHCNTGGLVCAGRGTALGVITKAHQTGIKIEVFVDETRPLLQGARLNSWELTRAKIPFRVITDGMAAFAMKKHSINSVFIGADRIAKNGDVANKVGSYSLAIAASYHNIPFYVVAPSTTLDKNCATGADIPIEERSSSEVHANAPVWNPAFDVVPRSLIAKIILESGEY